MTSFKLPSRIEQQYAASIQKIMEDAFRLKTIGAEGLIGFFAAITNEGILDKMSELIATKLIRALYRHNKDRWLSHIQGSKRAHEISMALKQEMNGPVGQLVNALIDRNAFYISSAPLEISKLMVKKSLEMQQNGMRASQIAFKLQKMAPTLTKSRINLIARTEVSKSSTALTQAQSYELGLRWYVWKTSEDGRVRSSHKHMQDVLIQWTDPPSPERLAHIKSSLGKYNAGEAPNCRCYAEPLIDIDDISWPHKVYTNNRIVRMSRSKFKELI